MTDQPETPYKVVNVGESGEQLKALMREAIRLGIREDFLTAVKAVAQRLTVEPLQWGDPLYQLRYLELLLHRGTHPPLNVLYAVDEQRKLVYITQFQPMPGRGFPDEN